MKTKKEIPYEILSKIFLYITDKKQLQECQLTCKGRGRAAQKQIYKKVQIQSSKSARAFFKTLEESPTSPGYLMKLLDMKSGGSGILLNNTNIKLLVGSLSNLDMLVLDDHARKGHSTAAITDTNTNIIEAHYDRLASVAQQRFDFKIMMPHVELSSRISTWKLVLNISIIQSCNNNIQILFFPCLKAV